MNNKNTFISNVISKMQNFIDADTVVILNKILSSELKNYDLQPCSQKDDAISDEHIFEMYKSQKASRLSASTITYYLSTMKRLATFANKSLIEITSADIQCFLDSLSKNNSAVSLNNHRRNMATFFSWMRKTHLIFSNPCDDIEVYKQVQKPIDHLEAEDVEQLKTGCTKLRDRALIEFLRCTACRVGEISKIKISDIDWSKGTIMIYGEKALKYRVVCLDSVAIKYLTEYITSRNLTYASNEYLFTHYYDNGSLSKGGIRESVKNIKRKSKIDRNIYPHLFRKTTATNIVKRGGTVHDAGEYLGHKDSSTAGKHYSFIGAEHTIDIFRKYVASV